MEQQSSASEHPAQSHRIARRLWLAQSCLYFMLLPVGAIYLFLYLFAGKSFWLFVLRFLLSVACLSLAFVENSLRCHPATKAARVETADETVSPVRRFLPPGVQFWVTHVQQHLLTTLAAAFAALVFALLNMTDTLAFNDISALNVTVIGVLIAFCFALLVIERLLSFKSIQGLRYPHEHIGMARIILTLFLILTTALLSANLSAQLAVWLIKLGSFFTLLVALEYLLRALVSLGNSPQVKAEPDFLTRSLLITLYHWPPRPLALLLSGIHSRFGVDIARIQAFQLIGKRLLPVSCLIFVVGWLLSGLTEIPLQQRGIYERFGRPIGVLSPGLHAGLPWPFGRVIFVENGTVHELQLGDITEKAPSPLEPNSAEGPAPQSTWRLWDNNHATDQSQVIASTASDKQNFQIVNMDIRLIWRVGLHDSDALSSQYQAERLPELIRSIARQVLVKQFASAQLDELLTGQQVALPLVINQKIQQRLNALNSGVELLFTRIEAIHPPVGAADAWHGVQAAQITENAVIAREKGYAASMNSDAQNRSLTLIHDAQAIAAENLAQANAAATHFAAEHQAWQQAGNAFILERRYQIFSQALAHAPLLILDNHLPDTSKPVLDFRQTPDLPDSTAAQKASTK